MGSCRRDVLRRWRRISRLCLRRARWCHQLSDADGRGEFSDRGRAAGGRTRGIPAM